MLAHLGVQKLSPFLELILRFRRAQSAPGECRGRNSAKHYHPSVGSLSRASLRAHTAFTIELVGSGEEDDMGMMIVRHRARLLSSFILRTEPTRRATKMQRRASEVGVP